MEVDRIEGFIGGWVVGDFDPSKLRMDGAEFSVKYYKAGASEDWHVHKVATEITVIVYGSVRMNGRVLREGDVVTLRPGQGTDFHCLTDTATAVFKAPSVIGDKYTRDQA
ncbi:MAG: cupin domain-containing protein [Gammaproteobacteria bacterium]|nr:cupin domain-containing protein [Gammaproteobacteria bacterium]